MKEIFVNRVWATLSAGIDNAVTTLPLTTGQGARFGTISAGEKIRIVFLDASLNVSEIAYMTAISGDNATIVRGTPSAAQISGVRIEARVGKQTMDALMQAPDIQDGAPTNLGTVSGVDTITAAATPTRLTQAATGSLWKFQAAGANTGAAATINIDGQGAVSLLRPDGSALLAGDIPAANYPCLIYKRAGDFILVNAAIVDNAVNLTGSGTVSATTTGGFGLTPTYATNATYSTNATNATNLTGSGTISYTTTATTLSIGDNSTKLATTAYADTHVPKDLGASYPVGTILYAYCYSPTTSIAIGGTSPGSNLRIAYTYTNAISYSTPAGTWRSLVDHLLIGDNVNYISAAGVFQRIS